MSALLAFLFVLFFFFGISPSKPPVEAIVEQNVESDEVWGLAYFRQRYPTRIEVDSDGTVREVKLPEPMAVEQLHIALSTDGWNWTPLNDNKPLWQQRLRDPYIWKNPEGIWHLMGTGRAPEDPRNDQRPLCLHATSKDLITWDTVESLPLMADVTDEQGRSANNIWAPEFFYDEENERYMLLWSSSFEDTGWKKSQLWYSFTKDWKNFTKAEVLFSPGYSSIDGTILKEKETYYLYYKEEEFGEKTGERRAIRVATSDKLTGPYKEFEGPLNDGQIVPTITEGCSIMPDPKVEDGWLLLYDYCMTDRFGASASVNLLDWKVLEDVDFPANARHGSSFKLTAEEAAALKAKFE